MCLDTHTQVSYFERQQDIYGYYVASVILQALFIRAHFIA